LLLLLTLFSACVAGGGGGGQFVMIGLEPEAKCTEVGPVKVTRKSKPEVKDALKQKTASMGGDFVRLKGLTFDRAKGDYTATGTAYNCK
jgi:hypothetical protein